MALRLTGNLNPLKSILYNSSSCSIIPSFLNIQVRHRRRKGYREKAEALKRKAKVEKMLKQPQVVKKPFLRFKMGKVEKTIESGKPDHPKDDIFIVDNFKPVKYSLVEAVNFHKEYFHPTVFNNQQALVNVRIELDLTGKKNTQLVKPFKGVAGIPHPIQGTMKRDILVFCEQEYASDAVAAGAKVCGGKEVVKKVKEGVIQIASFDCILCHVNFLPELTPIRKILKLEMPRLKAGTLTANLPATIHRFLHGIQYEVYTPSSGSFGIVDCTIGNVEMEGKCMEENFKALLKNIYEHKPLREGDFVTWIWCTSPTSPEKFAIDQSLYLEEEKREIDSDDDDDDVQKQYNEKAEIKKLQSQLEKGEESVAV